MLIELNITDAATSMCADEDDEVFETEDTSTTGVEDTSKRRSQSLSALSQATQGGDKVCTGSNQFTLEWLHTANFCSASAAMKLRAI